MRQRSRDGLTARWRNRIKLAAFAAYGGACACCGEEEPVFLTIDHVNGYPDVHGSPRMGAPLYSWLKKNDYPEGFQCLCWNCNSGRHLNGGVCPHQT